MMREHCKSKVAKLQGQAEVVHAKDKVGPTFPLCSNSLKIHRVRVINNGGFRLSPKIFEPFSQR